MLKKRFTVLISYIKLMDCWILDIGIHWQKNRLIVYLYFILKVCIRKVVWKTTDICHRHLSNLQSPVNVFVPLSCVQRCGSEWGWCIIWVMGPRANPANIGFILIIIRVFSVTTCWHGRHVWRMHGYPSTNINLIFRHHLVPLLHLLPLFSTTILKPYFHLQNYKFYLELGRNVVQYLSLR